MPIKYLENVPRCVCCLVCSSLPASCLCPRVFLSETLSVTSTQEGSVITLPLSPTSPLSRLGFLHSLFHSLMLVLSSCLLAVSLLSPREEGFILFAETQCLKQCLVHVELSSNWIVKAIYFLRYLSEKIFIGNIGTSFRNRYI